MAVHWENASPSPPHFAALCWCKAFLLVLVILLLLVFLLAKGLLDLLVFFLIFFAPQLATPSAPLHGCMELLPTMVDKCAVIICGELKKI